MKKVAAHKAKLNKSVVDRIEPPAEGKIIVWDADLAGFGVAVTSLGVKSWIINYRTRDGRQRRLVIGRCDRLSADRARVEARAKLAEVDVGGDPATERRELRARMGRVPQSGVGAVGNWPAAATVMSLAAVGQLSTAVVIADLR